MKETWLPGLTSFSQWETSNCLGGMRIVLQDQIGTVECQNRESIRMNLMGYPKASGVAVTCLETALGFPKEITWRLVTKLVYQVFDGDLDKVRSFMRISHGNRDHQSLAARTMWAIFKCSK
eukprot:14158878-Ditylum_brightwellii.AAC.1